MGTIFISYRRDDSSGHTGRLFDALCNRFGSESVFRDIEDLEPGIDFVEALDKALDKCDVLLLIIGRSWLAIEGPKGRRLDQPEDFVRMEVAKALERNVRLVPVLVDGATMPGPEELPDNLRLLARRNAIELSDTRWDYDIGRLGDTLAKVLNIQQPAAAAREADAPAATESTRKRGGGLKFAAAIAAAVVLAVAGFLFLSFDDATVTEAKTSVAVQASAAETQKAQEERQAAAAQARAAADRQAADAKAEEDRQAVAAQARLDTERQAVLSRAREAELELAAKQTAVLAERQAVELRRTQAAAIDSRQGFGTDGYKVSQVSFGDPKTGSAAGHFLLAGTSVWVETGPATNDVRFKFREVARDDWSVYLEDPSRDMSIQLDLYTRLVSFGDIGKERSPLYDIVGAK